MTKEEKEKKKLEKQKIKEEKKAQKLARKEEKKIAKLKRKGLYIEPEPPKEEPQEEVELEEVQEQVEEIPQEEPQKQEESVPEPTEETPEEKPVQKKRKAPKQYHISLRVDNKWQLKFGGSSKALKLFDTQKEAIEYAKPLAAKQKATLVVHKTDGKIRKQDYTKK